MTGRVRIERHVEQWWRLFALALFLLVPLDLLTTAVAVDQHGLAVEANPVVRWLFRRGPVAVATAHLAVVGAAAGLFHVALRIIARAPPHRHRSLVGVVNAWMAVIIVAGVVLVANNLLVVL